MKNHKTLIIFAVLLVLAYFDDPDMFSLQENEGNTAAYLQANLNTTNQQQRVQGAGGTLGQNKSALNKSNNGFSSNRSANKMTIVKCIQQGDNIVAAAFMLPPRWQTQCSTQYKMQNNTLSADSLYQAQSPSKNIRLFNEPSYTFYYDKFMLDQMIATMQVPGVDAGMLQGSGYNDYMRQQTELFKKMYPQALNLVQFAQQNLPPLLQKEGFELYHISRDPIEQILKPIFSKGIRAVPNVSDVDVSAITSIARSVRNPNEIKMMKTLQIKLYMGSPEKYSWILLSFNASGDEQHAQEMSKLINMVINTKQDNPRFTQLLAKVNSQMLRAKIKEVAKTSEIRRRANDEISDMINKAYQNRQVSSDRIQSKWVDANWEVENYRDPFSGQQVKLPSSNNYYFTNNLDDYIGTNNPLLEPNVDLNYLYNWQKLERM